MTPTPKGLVWTSNRFQRSSRSFKTLISTHTTLYSTSHINHVVPLLFLRLEMDKLNAFRDFTSIGLIVIRLPLTPFAFSIHAELLPTYNSYVLKYSLLLQK